MARKTKKQLLVEDITKRLKEGYGLSEKELTSGSAFIETARFLPDEIAEEFFGSYGVEPSKKEFGGWPEFINCLADAVLSKKKKSLKNKKMSLT